MIHATMHHLTLTEHMQKQADTCSMIQPFTQKLFPADDSIEHSTTAVLYNNFCMALIYVAICVCICVYIHIYIDTEIYV
jgi:hypothetical protein